jgi:cobalt-zinc-cadmium efflux system membrane fusion protein
MVIYGSERTSVMATAPTNRKSATLRRVAFLGLFGAALVGLSAAGTYFAGRWFRADPQPAVKTREATAETVAPAGADDRVHFDGKKWSAAGLEVAPAEYGDLAESVWVTGKVALNEEHLAHIYPLVEGVVREVKVRFGQEVQAGTVLTVLDSKEVGTTKLDLVRNRLAVEFALINEQWSKTIKENTHSLIEALIEEVPVLEIEERFRDQPMGDYRQQLVTSYSHLQQTTADYERVRQLYDQNIATQRDYVKAKTDFESARATYQAHLEAIKFASRQLLLAAEQKTKEALAARSVSDSMLLILGYREDDIPGMDPLKEGDQVAQYPVIAPLSGTVIKKDVVLLEHVVPQMQLFQIADLSTVWIQVDVFEKDLPLLYALAGKSLVFRAAGYPGREFEATVTYTGDIVDAETRAIRLIASADNPERLLKPGMFVEVSLPKDALAHAIVVPESAIERHAGRTFVFVWRGDDEFERRDVVAGRNVAGRLEIVSGLKQGEELVTKGGFALKSELLRELMTED